MGYLFPEANSVHDHDLVWQAAKLAEECGELAQVIIKGEYNRIPEEGMDVIQVVENIFRQINMTQGIYDEAVSLHEISCRDRGYYIDPEAMC